jgi:thiamine pyrophosphate-dependent acetolactate synthase large subunit-like protein
LVAWAASGGVAGVRVEGAEEVGEAVRAAWEAGVPQLIEVPIAAE